MLFNCIITLWFARKFFWGGLSDSLCRIAVPCFFAISGYCFKKFSNREKYIIKNCLIFCVATSAYAVIFFLTNSYKVDCKDIARFFLLQDTDCIQAGHLWFLLALIYCQICIYVSFKWNISTRCWIAIIVLLLTIQLFLGYINLYTNISISSRERCNFITMGIPFFVIGILNVDREMYKNLTLKQNYLIGIFGVLITLIERYIYNSNMIIFIGSIILTILIICNIERPICKQGKLQIWLETLGERESLIIYIIHPLVIKIYDKFFNESFGTSWIRPIIIFAVSYLIAHIIMVSIKLHKKEKDMLRI